MGVDCRADDLTSRRWPWLLAGLGGAVLAHLIVPATFVWVLCAIPHEMGHATVGCWLGRPSSPAISLAGHAWSHIGELRPWLPWTILVVLLGVAWHRRHRRVLAVVLAVVAVGSPLVAFAKVATVAIAIGGHLGELAFAAYCYHLFWTGGYTGAFQERLACVIAGALLQVANLKLCLGLLTSAAARAHYATNGSLGMKNDYLVIAEDLCHCRLHSVALLMLVAAIAALPLGLLTGWLRECAGDPE